MSIFNRENLVEVMRNAIEDPEKREFLPMFMQKLLPKKVYDNSRLHLFLDHLAFFLSQHLYIQDKIELENSILDIEMEEALRENDDIRPEDFDVEE